MANGDDKNLQSPDEFMQQRKQAVATFGAGGSVPTESPDDFMRSRQAREKKQSVLTEPLVSSEKILSFDPTYEPLKKAAHEAEVKGQPWKAGAATFATGVNKTVADILSSFTSPVGIGLAALTGGEAAAGKAGYAGLASLLRAPQAAATAGFGAAGAKQAMTPQQKGEDLPSSLERRLLGASAAAGGAAGVGAISRDALHSTLRKQFKLDDDLAAKVSEKVVKTQQLRQQEQVTTAVTKRRVGSLEEQKMKVGSQLLADTTQALVEEQTKVSKPFHDIAEKIKEPVTDVPSIKKVVTQSFKDAGANAEEIPPAVFKALGPEAGPSVVSWFGKTMDVRQITERGIGQTPEARAAHVARLREAGVLPEEGGNVTFSDLTRVREDLMNAAESAKDTAVKRALYDAQDKISRMQEAAAGQKGLGAEYKTAKENYMKFKRGIGSELISKWLSAYDMEDQAIAPKVSKLFTPASSQALRSILKSVGIDTGPIDMMQGAVTKEKLTGRGEVSEARREVKKSESAKEIIPGTKVSDLVPLSNQDLLRQRLRQQADSMKDAGIKSPFAMMQITIGLFQLARASMWGMFHLTRGMAMTKIPGMVRDPAFQDWVLSESGVEDPKISAKIRRGLADLYPALRKAVASGIQEQATSTASSQPQGQPQPEVAPAPAP